MRLLETLRECATRVLGTFRHTPDDRDLERELAFHLEMVEEDLRRRGCPPGDVARLARLEVGRSSSVLNELREQRGYPWLGRFTIDVVLGLRMLRKSWPMTLIGGFAIAIVIAVAAGLFSFFQVFTGRTVPLDEGDRVVAIQSYDPFSRESVSPALADYERWRDELESVETVGAFRTLRLTLMVGDGAVSAAPIDAAAELVSVAEMTASGFRLPRVPPLLGRPLVERDEAADAPPVVVIGESVWRSRFNSDPQVVGQSIRLGDTLHTVVGVMPEDFAFPINHQYWIALRADISEQAWRTGPRLVVFGRLAPGFTLEGAQAELSAMGLLPAAASTEPDAMRPRIVPYAQAFIHILPSAAAGILLLVTLLLIPPCANVAILVYARTATRQAEFAARFALGASRARIVGQIFIEALVLAALAALVALAFVHVILSGIEVRSAQSPGASPFWMDFGISFETLLYVAGLVVLAALIAGAAPALRATSGLMDEGLRALNNRVGVRLGATWTALVVVQIAIAVAILPSAAELTWGFLRTGMGEPGFPTREFATARLELDETNGRVGDGVAPFEARFADRQRELARRLGAEGASAVTFSSAIAGAEQTREVVVEETADTADPQRRVTHDVGVNRIDAAFFDAFDARFLVGRGFTAGDFRADSDAIIVNDTFAREILGDASPLGRRVRYTEQPAQLDRWYEIVGVATDVPANDEEPRLYHPLVAGELNPVMLTLRTRSDRVGMDRLRELAARVDSRLGIEEYRTLDETYAELRAQDNAIAIALVIVATSVLLLSAAGMYALMSFTVNQRRREIGIRAALGARAGSVLAGVFRRALGQVSIGASVGLLLAFVVSRYLPIDQFGGQEIRGVVLVAATFMVVIGCLAAIGPARRALRVRPMEVLREDG